MSFKKLVKKWAQITGQSANSMCVASKYQSAMNDTDSMVYPSDLASWTLRKCDRADYKDWMPYRVREHGYQTRVYYVNINPQSVTHHHSLVLVVKPGVSVVIDEWDGAVLLSSRPANVDSGDAKPSEEDIIQLAGQLAAAGLTKNEHFTVNGKAVAAISRS